MEATKNDLKKIMDQYLERQKIMKKMEKICGEIEGKLGFIPHIDDDEKRELAIFFLRWCLQDLKAKPKIEAKS